MGKRLLARFAAAAAGGALVVGAAPALAQDSDLLELQDSHQNTFVDDEEFGAPECAEGTEETDPRMARRADDEDGWHLVAANGNIESLTVWFAPDGDPDTSDPVEITGVPEDGGDIDFYSVGPSDSRWQHAYVFAPAGWLLLTAEATVTSGQRLVVSHTCPGEPGDDPNNGDDPDNGKQPGNGTDPENEDTPPAGEGGDGADDESQLPVTGAPAALLAAAGAGLLAAGGVLLAVRRRRRTLFQLPGS